MVARWASLLLLLAAPAASGQGLVAAEWSFPDGWDGTLAPETETVLGTLVVQVACNRGAAGPFTTAVATVEIGSPVEGVIATGERTIPIDGEPCLTNPTGAAVGETTLSFGLTRDAPGLKRIHVDAEVSIEYNPPMPGEEPPLGLTFNLTADFWGPPLEVDAQSRVLDDGKTRFDLGVASHYNARTTVQARLVSISDRHAGLVVADDVILDSPTSDSAHSNATLPFRLVPPSGPWSQVTAVIRLTPIASDDPSQQGEAQEVHVTFRNTSMGRFVPAPPVPLLLVGLAAALLAARRTGGP